MARNVFSLLSEKIGGGKKPVAENFLALKVAKDSVAATFWQIDSGKVQIGQVAVAPIISDTEQGLLTAVDEVISKVTVGVVPEPKKIIFGVNEDCILDGKLHQDKLIELRKLCRELDLSPMGFVAMNEAVENLLREADGVPPTALLVGIDRDKIYVTLLKAGKNLGTFWEDYEHGLPESLDKAIRKFTGVDFLPARMVIYDGRSDLETLKQKIVAYPWTQKLPFLHFPKVEVLETSGAVKAVAAAGGIQLGGQLDLSSVELVKEDKTENTTFLHAQPVIEVENNDVPQTHNDEPLVESNLINEDAEIEIAKESEPLSISNSEPELEEVDPSELGFKTEEIERVDDEEFEKQGMLEDLPSDNSNSPPRGPVVTLPKISLPKFNISSVLSKVSFLKIPALKPTSSFGKPVLLLISILIVVILLIGGAVYFAPSANVTVFVKPIEIQKTLDLALVSEGSASTTSAAISGKTVEQTLSQTKKGITTGKKLVGTRAKGTVTIYNSSGAKTFPSGTSVVSNGLKFTMDDSVVLASSSGLASQSTASVSVTAGDIGENYNLPSGSLFSVAGLPTSSYQGKSDAAFAGGSSHQATVVSKEDQTRLLATASAELDSTAKDQLQSKLAEGETLLDKAITSKVSKKIFSKDIDVEADSLTLDLSVIYTGLVFDQKDAKNNFTENVAAQVPAGYDLLQDNIQVNLVKVSQLKNGTFILTISFSGRAMPVLDQEKLIKSSNGKELSKFIQEVKNNNGVDNVEVAITPKIFQSLQRLPFKSGKLKLEIVSL